MIEKIINPVKKGIKTGCKWLSREVAVTTRGTKDLAEYVPEKTGRKRAVAYGVAFLALVAGGAGIAIGRKTAKKKKNNDKGGSDKDSKKSGD